MQKKYAVSVLVMDEEFEVLSHDAIVVEADCEADAMDVSQAWAMDQVKKSGLPEDSVKITVRASEVTGGKKNVDIAANDPLHTKSKSTAQKVILWSPVITYSPVVATGTSGVGKRTASISFENVPAILDNGFVSITDRDATFFLPSGTVHESFVEWAKTELGALAYLRDAFMDQVERATLVKVSAEKAAAGYMEVAAIAASMINSYASTGVVPS